MECETKPAYWEPCEEAQTNRRYGAQYSWVGGDTDSVAQAEGMEVEGGEMWTEDMDEDDDDFAPDENLPQTAEAEDEALLAPCNQET